MKMSDPSELVIMVVVGEPVLKMRNDSGLSGSFNVVDSGRIKARMCRK